MAQRLVWSFFVVLFKPQFCLFAYFPQALKDKHIEHRFTVAAIESFDEAVLHRPSRFDELEPHVVLFSPISQRHRDYFWIIVESQLARIAACNGYGIERAHDAGRRQIEVHVDRQPFAIEMIHHVEGTKATITP